MPDAFTKRSEVMARIRGRGNRDTELALARLLRAAGITGWRRQRLLRFKVSSSASKVQSVRVSVRPDFVFPHQRLAVFVDGCFWHGCPLHSPPARWLRKSDMPALVAAASQPEKRQRSFDKLRVTTRRTGKAFWRQKLAANQRRDRLVNRSLRKAGWRVVRIGEHDLTDAPAQCVLKIRRALAAPRQIPSRRKSNIRNPGHLCASRSRGRSGRL